MTAEICTVCTNLHSELVRVKRVKKHSISKRMNNLLMYRLTANEQSLAYCDTKVRPYSYSKVMVIPYSVSRQFCFDQYRYCTVYLSILPTNIPIIYCLENYVQYMQCDNYKLNTKDNTKIKKMCQEL